MKRITKRSGKLSETSGASARAILVDDSAYESLRGAAPEPMSPSATLRGFVRLNPVESMMISSSLARVGFSPDQKPSNSASNSVSDSTGDSVVGVAVSGTGVPPTEPKPVNRKHRRTLNRRKNKP